MNSSRTKNNNYLNAIKTQKIHTAPQLPPDWDKLTDSYFQSKEFLNYCEKYNSCHQRYYLLFENNILIAGAVVYTLLIDLFTFSSLSLPVKMQVAGIPASVSSSGIIGPQHAVEYLIREIIQAEKGLFLGVNLPSNINTTPGIVMPILPNVEMPLSMESWNDYIRQLRAPYRRRVFRIIDKFNLTEETKTSCQTFTKEHYQLYLAIIKRTPNKLEVLPEDFFRYLPNRFQLTTYRVQNEILCWHISCQEGERFYFFFGGNNYKWNDKYDAYFNNLFGILKESLERNCTYLDLGQTAEIPKMRLGGTLVPKQLFLYHQNKLILWILNKLKYFIGYRGVFAEVHVFKQQSNPSDTINKTS